MTTSMKKQQLYGEYINPTTDPCSPKKENPLVLMAQACNNIGKELSNSSNLSITSKQQRKSNSPPEGKKSLKRLAPPSSSPPPAPKKMTLPSIPTPLPATVSTTNPSSYLFPPSPFMVDSLLLHHLKTFTSSPFFSIPSFGHSSNSAFSPSSSSSSSPSQRSPYFMDSILSPLKPSPSPFVCNWMDSTIPDGFCGKRFANHLSLLEHLCTAHTSLSTMKSFYPTSYFSPTSVGKL